MAIPTNVRESICPLCERPKAMGRQAKRLYEGYACKKCVYAFANRRQFAYIVDSLVVMMLVMVFEQGLVQIGANANWAEDLFIGSMAPLVGIPLFLLYTNILNLPFYFKDGFKGRSPGKMMMGVSVVDEATYEPTDFGRSFKRNIALIIPFSVLIALFQMNSGRRLGDKFAKTRVIWDKYRHKFPFEARGYICQGCGYDLRGNVSGKCSECGRAISANPAASGVAPMAEPV